MQTTTIVSHLDDEILEPYALGHLSEASVCELDEHLLLCQSCQVRLNEVEQFLQVTSVAAAELRKQPFRSRLKGFSLMWLWQTPKPLWASAMAAVVLMVGISAYHPAEPVGAPHEVLLSASRGIDNRLLAHTQPGSLILNFDASEIVPLPEYHVQIVTSAGKIVWNGTVAGAAGMLQIPVSYPISAGTYWVRLYGQDRTDLLREYGLEIK